MQVYAVNYVQGNTHSTHKVYLDADEARVAMREIEDSGPVHACVVPVQLVTRDERAKGLLRHVKRLMRVVKKMDKRDWSWADAD